MALRLNPLASTRGIRKSGENRMGKEMGLGLEIGKEQKETLGSFYKNIWGTET